MKPLVLMLICVSATSAALAQQTRYVRDVLWVPLHSGQSEQHRIVHKGLISGTAVQVLEVNESSGYSRVRLADNVEGWIQTQYLVDEPAARDQLASATSRLNKLQQENAQLQQQLSMLQEQSKDNASGIDNLSLNNTNLNAELERLKAISADAMRIDNDNRRLLEENQTLKNDLDVLRADHTRLSDDRQHDRFLDGAYAVLIGVLITLAVPRLWPRRKTEWA